MTETKPELITEQKARELMDFNDVDVESGMEYLNGLEVKKDDKIMYKLNDVLRFILR